VYINNAVLLPKTFPSMGHLTTKPFMSVVFLPSVWHHSQPVVSILISVLLLVVVSVSCSKSFLEFSLYPFLKHFCITSFCCFIFYIPRCLTLVHADLLRAMVVLVQTGGITPVCSWPWQYMEWVVSIRPCLCSVFGNRTHSTHWMQGLVGLRTCLGTEARRKMLCLCWESNPGHPVCGHRLYWLSYHGSCLTLDFL
jgi:hypothetical protein